MSTKTYIVIHVMYASLGLDSDDAADARRLPFRSLGASTGQQVAHVGLNTSKKFKAAALSR